MKFTLSQGDTQIGDAVTVQALETYDFIARSAWDGLSPGTEYTCKTEIGADENSLQPGPTATFSTLYGAELNEPLSLWWLPE